MDVTPNSHKITLKEIYGTLARVVIRTETSLPLKETFVKKKINENFCEAKIENEEASVRNGMLCTFPGAVCITTSYVKASNTLKAKIGQEINIINIIMGANMLNYKANG